jgi:transcriptional regulator with GAF, ATPase, and Fis domain
MELQGKLLRVIQEGQFERVGEAVTRKVDVRLIAATNRDLRREVREGRFREDLYFRLNVFPIESVCLRDRREDIPQLAAHFLQRTAQRLNLPGLGLTQGDVQALQAYDWPGNVRELENVIERAAIIAGGGRLRFDLPAAKARPRAARASAPAAERPLTEEERRQRVYEDTVAALRSCEGRVFGPRGAAHLLGLKPTTLASRLKAWGIDRRDYAG